MLEQTGKGDSICVGLLHKNTVIAISYADDCYAKCSQAFTFIQQRLLTPVTLILTKETCMEIGCEISVKLGSSH